MLKRLYRHILPSPKALTAVWISLGIFFVLSLTSLLFTITQPDKLISFLLILSVLALPGCALLLVVAAWIEAKAASRAILWGAVTLTIGLATVGLSASMYLIESTQLQGPAVWWIFGCCLSPLFLIPGGLTLVFAVRSWSQLRAALNADRAQRTLELLSARGEASFAEIGHELDLPEHQVEVLLNEWREAGRLTVIIAPSHRQVYTLIALFEKSRRLEAIIQARGQIHLADLEQELRVPRDLLREWVRTMVHKKTFSGYVDWDAGLLSSLEVDQLQDQEHCPHCGGETSLAGRGLIRCRYCGVEIFLPTESSVQPQEVDKPAKISMTDYDREEIPALFYGEPRLGKAANQPSTVQKLWQLFLPNKRARRVLTSALLTFVLCSICSLVFFDIQEEISNAITSILLLQGVFIIPLVAILLVSAAFVDKYNPARMSISLLATMVVGGAGLLVAILMSIDPEAGLDLAVHSMILVAIPLMLLFSLPVIYFGLKSWPDVQAVLRLQTGQRVLKLIQERGAISFEEISKKLLIPYDKVDDLVDSLLRAGDLYGTMDAERGWVYSAKSLEEKRTQLLAELQIRGQISLDKLVRQLEIPLALLRDLIYQVVQLQQFSGYINWKEGRLYSVAAEKLGAESQCPQCGGQLGLEGEIIECQYCGSEILRG